MPVTNPIVSTVPTTTSSVDRMTPYSSRDSCFSRVSIVNDPQRIPGLMTARLQRGRAGGPDGDCTQVTHRLLATQNAADAMEERGLDEAVDGPVKLVSQASFTIPQSSHQAACCPSSRRTNQPTDSNQPTAVPVTANPLCCDASSPAAQGNCSRHYNRINQQNLCHRYLRQPAGTLIDLRKTNSKNTLRASITNSNQCD